MLHFTQYEVFVTPKPVKIVQKEQDRHRPNKLKNTPKFTVRVFQSIKRGNNAQSVPISP